MPPSVYHRAASRITLHVVFDYWSLELFILSLPFSCMVYRVFVLGPSQPDSMVDCAFYSIFLHELTRQHIFILKTYIGIVLERESISEGCIWVSSPVVRLEPFYRVISDIKRF